MKHTRISTLAGLALTLSGIWIMQGCGNSTESKCDTGQTLQNNLCVAAPSGTGGDATGAGGANPTGGTGGSADVADANTSSEGAAPASDGGGTYGTPCVQSGPSPECAAPSSYCGIQPGKTVGYCTAIGCKADPTLCPATWTCFDVGTLNFCMAPL